MEEEKGCKGCMDVTAQPLKGEEMPLQRSPCDDFTSTVTPLDPDTPPLSNPKPQPSLPAAAGSHWPAECRCGGGEEGLDREKESEGKEGEERGGEQREGGHAKGQLLVRGFYWECRREGAGVGVCVKDHRLRF